MRSPLGLPLVAMCLGVKSVTAALLGGLLVLTGLWPANLVCAQTVVLSENFEAPFPEAGGWIVGDQDPNGITAFWDDVDLFSFGSPPIRGSAWAGYCAGSGYSGSPFQPFYQSSMGGYMGNILDLRGYTTATLTFWETVPSIEPDYDQCAVFINQQPIYVSSASFGWTHTTVDLTPFAGTLSQLTFVFFSDGDVQGEGWYLDDIVVTAGQSRPSIVRGPYLQSATVSNIVIRWRSDFPTSSTVRFGTNAQNLNVEVSEPMMKTEHGVTLHNLRPDTRYYYAVMSGSDVLAGGPDYQFVTSPLSAKPTRIWVLGDSGTAGFSSAPLQVRDAYYQFTGQRPTDVWLMLGDNAYGSGTDSEYQTAVFGPFSRLLRQTALWSTLGNHETYDPSPSGGIAYFDIFTLPTDGRAGGTASGSERYYSFDYGNIHFVCLDSEISDKQPGSPMLAWLAEDLAANTKDWLIAFWHSPPYSKGSHDSDNPFDSDGNLISMRVNVVPILESYGVDIVLCGHSHSYERSYLLAGHYGHSTSLQPSMIKDSGNGRLDGTGAYRTSSAGGDEGTVYVVAGSSGQVSGGFLNHPAMFMSLSRLGSLVIDVDGQRLDAQFLRETGAIDDHFSIIKGAPLGPLRWVKFHLGGGVMQASFASIAGKSYRIERTSGLENPAWTNASDNIRANGSVTHWTSPVPSVPERSFFRVRQVP